MPFILQRGELNRHVEFLNIPPLLAIHHNPFSSLSSGTTGDSDPKVKLIEFNPDKAQRHLPPRRCGVALKDVPGFFNSGIGKIIL